MLHFCSTVRPDIDREAKALFSDLDRLMNPNLQDPDTDQTYPLQSYYDTCEYS